MENVYEWFVYNSPKANPDKFKFIILGNTCSHTLKLVKLACSMIESQFAYCPLILDVLLQ